MEGGFGDAEVGSSWCVSLDMDRESFVAVGMGGKVLVSRSFL